MHITWLEMKKVLLSPDILVLLILMIVFNIFTIFDESYYNEELQIVNEIIETYGLSFDDEILQMMEQDIDQMVILLGGTNTQNFLDEMTFEKYDKASTKERQQIDHIRLLYTYIQAAKELEERYTAININQLKDDFVKEENMTSWLEKHMSNEFDNWQARFDQIVVTNEYKQWFFLGEYHMHSGLFRSLMKNLAFEGVLLIILLTALITNYEFENRTQLVTYATKIGRRLIWHKRMASLVCSLIVIGILFGLSLATYFVVNDYSAVWQTYISSGLNWESNLPYITWWAIPLWQYLLLVISILIVVLLIISMMTFAISVFVKNSYFTWLICVLALMAIYVVPFYFTNSTLLWLMYFNITLLLLNPHMYFSGGTTFMMSQYHEVWTVLLWLLLVIIGSFGAIRYFNRKDVV
ncbi:hypothetical protein ABE042_03830 [Viridibacillus arvi]|uniref:hypothetical protein n=1 Tax=Viridibacillus arvi TaxID=263475 RepID=UPI003D2E0B98